MVSIIVPVYNVMPYIGKCLESVIEQSYQDFELILVDDCCTDDTMVIVDRFVHHPSLQNKIQVLRHKYNRGLSAARNTGVMAAKGEYIYFLDSDDYISSNCLQALIQKVKETDADIVVGNIHIEHPVGEQNDLRLKKDCIEDYNNFNPFHAYLKGYFYMMAWNKLIRRSFLEKHNITFVEGLIHEDCAWSFTIACLVTKIAFVFEDTYHYIIRQGSIQTDKDFNKHFNAYCYLLKYYASEAIRLGKVSDSFFLNWLEKQKAFFYDLTSNKGTKKQTYIMYSLIRGIIPQRIFDKGHIHYFLPKYLGLIVYNKWNRLFAC